jgi:hypothetical protein
MKKLVGGIVLAIVVCLTFSTVTFAEGFAHFFKKGNVIGQTLFVGAAYHKGASYHIRDYMPCNLCPPEPCEPPGDWCCNICPDPPDYADYEIEQHLVTRLFIRNVDTASIEVTAIELYDRDGVRISNYDDVVALFLSPLPGAPLTIGPRASKSIRLTASAFMQAGHFQPDPDCPDPPPPGGCSPVADPLPFPMEGGRCHFIVKWESVDGKPVLPPSVGAALVSYKGWRPMGPGLIPGSMMYAGWGPTYITIALSEAIVIEEETCRGWRCRH